jgi:hypothetical protein
MITEISRTLTGKYIYANTSIMFDANPYLLATNDLILYFTNNDARYAAKVISVSGNTAVIDFSNPQYANNSVTTKTPQFGSGLVGPQEVFSFKLSTPPNAIIQVSSNGGTSSVNLEASTDQVNWITLSTIPVTVANSNTFFTTVTSPWPYGRINVASIGAGNYLTVNKAI